MVMKAGKSYKLPSASRENQESWWWNSVWVWSPEGWGGMGEWELMVQVLVWVTAQSQRQGQRLRSQSESRVWGPRNVFALPPPLFVVFRPSVSWMSPPILVSLYCLLNHMLISSEVPLWPLEIALYCLSWHCSAQLIHKVNCSVASFGDYLSRRHSF